MSAAVFLIFNGVGIVISVSAIAVIAHTAINMTGIARKGLFSFIKGFILIGLSFTWTLFFGQLVIPAQLLSIQSVLLSFGMAFLIYSANKIFEIHEKNKNV
jgi:hypothetical protein